MALVCSVLGVKGGGNGKKVRTIPKLQKSSFAIQQASPTQPVLDPSQLCGLWMICLRPFTSNFVQDSTKCAPGSVSVTEVVLWRRGQTLLRIGTAGNFCAEPDTQQGLHSGSPNIKHVENSGQVTCLHFIPSKIDLVSQLRLFRNICC